jgi:hypothetical protein
MLKNRIAMLQRAEREAIALFPASIQASATSALPNADQTAGFNGLRLARYCTLEEVVGLAFGLMTVLYIVTSLASLS